MKIFKVKDDYHNKDIVTRVVDEDDPSNRVEILSVSPWNTKDEDKVYGVNWQAIGTATVEEAENYIKLIQAAIAEAKKRNK